MVDFIVMDFKLRSYGYFASGLRKLFSFSCVPLDPSYPSSYFLSISFAVTRKILCFMLWLNCLWLN